MPQSDTSTAKTLPGYRHADGRAGCRNHLLVLNATD